MSTTAPFLRGGDILEEPYEFDFKGLDRGAQIERELPLIESRLGRLMEALVSGGLLETVVWQVKTEEERKKTLAKELHGPARCSGSS
ncbi:MAG TPA: hypothetical protein VFR64_06655 [Methylomirabilota bacterium]|nr:hypothetical protein [Methylomirabilota bacterium]